ncbi:MAG: hypothetical protein AUJ75_02665 [Candidatus Omnitrophica bacterium CG1_02_49_10]|nr:MAG: hypothetical protein AUJ75_02665 [Candidatus Omnitrophica bacterium CG1_02_49_10]
MKSHLIIISFAFSILALLLLSAFFSGAETALISLNRIRLKNLVNKGSKRAKVVQKLLSNIDDLITAILLGNNFVNTAISVTGTIFFAYLLGPRAGGIVAFIVIGTSLLIFGEITPKLFAAQHAQKVSLAVAIPMRGIVTLFKPVAAFLGGISDMVIRMLGGEPVAKSPLLTEEEIKLMIELGREQGVVGDEERKMLYKIFKFGDTLVEEVMVPKEKMVYVDIDTDIDRLLEVVLRSGYARIPVYDKAAEGIVGIIYIKDLLKAAMDKKNTTIKDLIHMPHFVVKSKRVIDLLRELQNRKGHIAIVTDAKGVPIGIVTLEDLLEEIVGEIE